MKEGYVNYYLREDVDKNKKIKLRHSNSDFFSEYIWDFENCRNFYNIGRLPLAYYSEIISKYRKVNPQDFVEAVVLIRKIIEPYLMMEKLTGE